MAIRKLLVANRGEIAARVFRTCERLGIATVAVVAPDDRGAYHARRAGEVEEVAGYLDAGELVAAARRSRADAIHPGYGFLAESGDFAEAVERAGLLWVGPPVEALRLAGDKLEAKRVAAATGVPLVPSGTPAELGFPLLVKAAGGGGGRGMRVVSAPEELEAALESSEREAESAFGNGTLFLERFLPRPRHLEIQLLADGRGAVVALGERECSIQRRHQKLLEESPSPAIGDALRARMEEAAVALARAVGYRGAGTVEFLVDGSDFFFLELNARIQVEHPVTELVTGLDLVEAQLRIAEEGSLPAAPARSGHAIEARLYAEDPRTFLPQAGSIEALRLPAGVRVDAGVEAGDAVPLAYDPLLAKLISHGDTRGDALDRLRAALAETAVTGVRTNLALLRWLVAHPAVRAAETTTAFLTEHPPLSRSPRTDRPWRGYWRPSRDPSAPPPAPAAPPQVEDAARDASSAAGGRDLTAPTPGTIVRVLVAEGERVEARQPLVVLEAMKMETPLLSPYDAVVRRVRTAEGDRVAVEAVLVELEAI